MCYGPGRVIRGGVDAFPGTGDPEFVRHGSESALEQARYLATQPELLDKSVKCFAPGFIGFGGTKPGDKVLICVHSHADAALPQSLAQALREKGATVDV